MRVIIIPVDQMVSVDGVAVGGINMAGLSPDIHALQWYDTYGIVEYRSDRDNDRIEDLSPFQFIIDRYDEAKAWLDNKAADKFFDLTLQEARALKIGQILSFLGGKQAEEYDSGTNRLAPTGIQSMEELLSLALLVKASGDTTWTADVILTNTNPNGTNKRIALTADQIIAQVREIKQRNEDLNQMAQDHIDNVTLLVSVEAIRDYELPT